MYVCISVCHGAPSNCFFFFVSRWNRAIFWPSILHVALCKTVFFNFWFRPPKPKIYCPKFGTKSPISQFVWQRDRKCFGLLGGFRGCLIQWNHAKMLWGRPLLPWQRNFGKFGLFFSQNAYKSACMPDWPDMFGPTRGDDQEGRSLCNDICAKHGV